MDRYMFRGKRLDTGEWVYGYLFKIWEKTYILWGTTNGVPNMIEVDPARVGQYTNQKDIEKTELYEKDIVQHVNAKWLGVIHFADGSYRVQTKHGTWELLAARADKVVKVGDIYSNPELVEG